MRPLQRSSPRSGIRAVLYSRRNFCPQICRLRTHCQTVRTNSLVKARCDRANSIVSGDRAAASLHFSPSPPAPLPAAERGETGPPRSVSAMFQTVLPNCFWSRSVMCLVGSSPFHVSLRPPQRPISHLPAGAIALNALSPLSAAGTLSPLSSPQGAPQHIISPLSASGRGVGGEGCSFSISCAVAKPAVYRQPGVVRQRCRWSGRKCPIRRPRRIAIVGIVWTRWHAPATRSLAVLCACDFDSR